MMRSIDTFLRMNKIEGNIFMSFDLDELEQCDLVACQALKVEEPHFILPVLFDNSTITMTMRYSVPEDYKALTNDMSELEILEVLRLYLCLIEAIESCEDWYLVASGICLDEKYIYVDETHTKLKMIYIPDEARKIEDQAVKHVMIALLEKCSEASGGTIQLQLYKYFYKPHFDLQEFKGMVEAYIAACSKKEKEQQVITPEPVISLKKEEPIEAVKTSEPVEVVKIPEPIEVVTKSVLEPTEILESEARKEKEGRPFYTPKVNRSQLSQEEIEAMVKSIYSGGEPKVEKVDVIEVTETASIYGRKEKEVPPVVTEEKQTTVYTRTKEIESNSKKKSLFENVFPGTAIKDAAPIRQTRPGRPAMLKSISMHARYDLPKQIDILLEDERFIIGRATRNGEPTGAQYEFSTEITPISRLHAQIEYKEGSYYIKDLGSSNGTYLNGVKLEVEQPYLIEDGDKIAFAVAYSKNSIEYAFTE